VKEPIRIAILEFPGTNCEQETSEAVIRAGMQPSYHRWNMDRKNLAEFDGYIIPGGFSYEDRSRSGVIAAGDPVLTVLKEESRKGKPVLGICNGAQILVESGMVPGIEDYRIGAALAENRRIADGKIQGTGFYNAWVNIKADPHVEPNAFTPETDNESVMRIPAAHAEGRFEFPEELLTEIEQRGLVAYRYTDPKGNVSPDFPHNPNGSTANCAGLLNAEGNIMALMPHPERTAAGDSVFSAMREYILARRKKVISSIAFLSSHLGAKPEALQPYRRDPQTRELIIGMIITDNAAVSVEQALRSQKAAVSVNRYVHWEIEFEPGTSEDQKDLIIEQVIATGELYNPNKEYPATIETAAADYRVLVRQKTDTKGEHVHFTLTNWFSIVGVTRITSSILWVISPDETGHIQQSLQIVESSGLLANPISHRSWMYE
jgi:phosphoribosylformylglycinamidine synthase